MIYVLTNGLQRSHPYFALLYGAVAKDKNFFVYDVKDYYDLLNKLLKNSEIVHLHWIEAIFRGPPYDAGMSKCIFRSLIYMFAMIGIKYVLRKKIVITLHNIKPHEIIYPRLEEFMFKFSINIADAVIVHNNYSKDKAIDFYKLNNNNIKKMNIIPHGNFISYFKNNISKKKARKVLNIPEDKFVLLFFGQIRPETRGIEDLLKVLEDIFNENKNFFVILAGVCNKSLRKQLYIFSNKFKENSLIRLEFIPDDDIQIYMNAADVGILPFKRISTSGSLFLQMSFKKPVIVSDLEPIKELLGDDYPLYCDPDNKESLKRAILNARGIDLEKISEKVYKIAESYDWGKISKMTIEVYERVLEGKFTNK